MRMIKTPPPPIVVKRPSVYIVSVHSTGGSLCEAAHPLLCFYFDNKILADKARNDIEGFIECECDSNIELVVMSYQVEKCEDIRIDFLKPVENRIKTYYGEHEDD